MSRFLWRTRTISSLCIGRKKVWRVTVVLRRSFLSKNLEARRTERRDRTGAVLVVQPHQRKRDREGGSWKVCLCPVADKGRLGVSPKLALGRKSPSAAQILYSADASRVRTIKKPKSTTNTPIRPPKLTFWLKPKVQTFGLTNTPLF